MLTTSINSCALVNCKYRMLPECPVRYHGMAPDLWPANSLDLHLDDYCIWGHVYQKSVKDVDQLKQRLIEVWSGLQQTVVDEVIDEWRRRLRAYVRVKGQKFEHLLKI